MDDLPLYTLSALDFNHYYGQYCNETSPPLAAFPGWRCVLGGAHNLTVDLHLLYESIVGRGGVSESDPDDAWWEISRDSTLSTSGAPGGALPPGALLAPSLMRQVYQARIKGFIRYMADLVRRFEEQGQAPQGQAAAAGGQQQAQQAEQHRQAGDRRRLAAEQVAAQQRQGAAQQRAEQEALRKRQKQQAALAAARSAQQHAQQQAQRAAEVVDRRQQSQQQHDAIQQKRGRSAGAAGPVGTPEPAADSEEPPAKRTRGQQAAAGGSTPPPANLRYPRRTPLQQQPQQQPPQQQQLLQQQRLAPAVDTPDPFPGDQVRSMAAWLRGASLSLLEGPQAAAATAALARRYRPGLARLLAATTAALPPELYPLFGAKPPPRLARAPRGQPAAQVVHSGGERSSSPGDEMGIIRIGDHAQTPLPAYLGPAPPPPRARLSATESRYLSETRALYMPGEDARTTSGAAARAGARRAAKTDAAARGGGAAAAAEGPEERLGRSLARGRAGPQPSYAEFARAMARLGNEQQRQDLLRGALLQLDEEMGPDLVQRLGLTKLGCKLRVDWNGVDEALFAMGMLWKLRPKKAVQKEYLPHKSLQELQSYYYNVWKLRGTQLADYYYELEPYVRKTATDRRTELADAQGRAEIYDARVERVLAAERTKAELKMSDRGSSGGSDSGSGSGGDGSGGDSGEGDRDGSGGGAAGRPPPRREGGGGPKGRAAGPRCGGSSPQPRRGGGDRAGGGQMAAGAATAAAGGGIAPRRPAPVSVRTAQAPEEPKQQVQAAPVAVAAKAASDEPLPRGSDSSAATQSPASLSAPGGGGGGAVIQIPSSLLVPGPDGRSSLATGAGPGAAGSVAVVTSPRPQKPEEQTALSGGAADAQQAAAGEEAAPRRTKRDPRTRPPSWWQQGSGAAAASPPLADAAAAAPPVASEPSGLDSIVGAKGAELPGHGAEQQQAQQAAAPPKQQQQQQQQLVPLMRRGRGGVRVTWGRRRPQERRSGPSGAPPAPGGGSGGAGAAALQAGGPASPPAVGRPQPGSVLLVASPGGPGTTPKVIAVLASRSPTTAVALQQQQQQQQVRGGQQPQRQVVAEPPKRRHGPVADRDRLRRVRAWLQAACRDPTGYAATAATSRRATCARRACEARLAACPATWRAQLQEERDAAVAAAAAAGAAAKRAVAADGRRGSPRRARVVAPGKLQAS